MYYYEMKIIHLLFYISKIYYIIYNIESFGVQLLKLYRIQCMLGFDLLDD